MTSAGRVLRCLQMLQTQVCQKELRHCPNFTLEHFFLDFYPKNWSFHTKYQLSTPPFIFEQIEEKGVFFMPFPCKDPSPAGSLKPRCLNPAGLLSIKYNLN